MCVTRWVIIFPDNPTISITVIEGRHGWSVKGCRVGTRTVVGSA